MSFGCTVQWLDNRYKVFPLIFADPHLGPYMVITILLTIFPVLYLHRVRF